MIEYNIVPLASLRHLRSLYLDSLPYPQELHCEWLVAKGTCRSIHIDGEEVGYFICLKEENQLVEFYLLDKMLSRKEEIFGNILEEFDIGSSFCKSFDDLHFHCGSTFCRSCGKSALLFRSFTDEIVMPLRAGVSVRKAKEMDIPLLLTHDSDLYESPDELNYTVSHRMVLMYEKDGILIGCGYLIRVLPDKDVFDIGMWVNPAFRGRGYATMIISHLKETCLKAGYTPIAGCSIFNTASYKTLKRCGFISEHYIVTFYFKPLKDLLPL